MIGETVSTIEEALAGLNGWHRWGSWAAHFFVDGKQSCNAVHSYAEGGMARGLPPRRPVAITELSRGGIPYGRVCQRCAKRATQHKSADPKVP